MSPRFLRVASIAAFLTLTAVSVPAFAQGAPAKPQPDAPEHPAQAEEGAPQQGAVQEVAPAPRRKDAGADQGASGKPAAPAAPAKPAAPAPELAPLAFLTGTWTQDQPGGAVIEETWSVVRGKTMLGAFRRVLGNGAVPFYEFTQIAVTKDGVLLRQLHVHGRFETDPEHTQAMVLRLVKAGDNSATFEPNGDKEASHAGNLDRMTYSLKDPDTLEVRQIAKAPPVKEGAAPGAPQELVFIMKRQR